MKRKAATTELDIGDGLEVLHDLALEQNLPVLAEHLNWLAQQVRYGDVSPEKLNEIGESASQKAYTDAVTTMATEAAQQVYDDNRDDRDGAREALHDRVWEDVDGSRWVIYTNNNFEVLRHSSNDRAGFEQGIVDPASNNLFAQLAFSAMHQDVMEEAIDLLDALFENATEEEEEEEEEA